LLCPCSAAGDSRLILDGRPDTRTLVALRAKAGRFTSPELDAIDALLRRAREWDAEADKMLAVQPAASATGEAVALPDVRAVRRLIERGKRAQFKFPQLPELEIVAAAGETWLRQVNRLFLRKGCKYTLAKALETVGTPVNMKKWAQVRARNEKLADDEEHSHCICQTTASGFVRWNDLHLDPQGRLCPAKHACKHACTCTVTCSVGGALGRNMMSACMQMTECEACHAWFHGRCVNFNERAAREGGRFVCPKCAREFTLHSSRLMCSTHLHTALRYVS